MLPTPGPFACTRVHTRHGGVAGRRREPAGKDVVNTPRGQGKELPRCRLSETREKQARMPWRSPPASVSHRTLPTDLKPIALHSDHPKWQKDSTAGTCLDCNKEFTVTRRRHHCRRCGFIFCDPCTAGRVQYAGDARAQRTCRLCRNLLASQVVARERALSGHAAPRPVQPAGAQADDGW